MTRKTFGELYAATRGGPIRYEGHDVHPAYEITTSAPIALDVGFVRASPTVRQALRVAVDGGTILVNGQQLRDVILWTDTAPPRQRLDVQPNGAQCRITVWNAWDDGGMQAWIGDCGMLIEPTSTGVRLRCSDGVGGPDFDDLVVELVTRGEQS
ncbi:MAG: hypothetical protein K8T90_18415 [Planctomycetes bacterium]|nr:hypothetical protein [Planctomycetota bacterium]